jgi:hypothetical protein
MPIAEADPWRMQYFEAVACPDDLIIPTEDADAYLLFPRHRWLYNKLNVAESQGLRCAPHGVEPDRYPVFSKPIYNMRGMGAGTRIFRSRQDYLRGRSPGHMWMELLDGEHVSTDIALVEGKPRWWRHAVGHAIGGGQFDYWVVEAADRRTLEADLGAWVGAHFPGYSGMMNLETIGGTVIEGHLRFSDQWPDLYGAGWLDSLVELYRTGSWSFADSERRDGFSFVLFGPHGVRYRHPPTEAVEVLLGWAGVSSIQITFHEDRPAQSHSMPPGGFRLAIVNGTDVATVQAARERLAALFGLKAPAQDAQARPAGKQRDQERPAVAVLA